MACDRVFYVSSACNDDEEPLLLAQETSSTASSDDSQRAVRMLFPEYVESMINPKNQSPLAYDAESVCVEKSAGMMKTISPTRRRLVLLMVFTALLVDNMLLTSIVPVVPDLLLKQRQKSLYESNQQLIVQVKDLLPSTSEKQHVEENFPVSQRQKGNFFLQSLNTFGHIWPSAWNTAYDDASMLSGLLFGSKAFVQLISAPNVGRFVDRHGPRIPLLFGSLVLLTSTLGFAFADTFWVLFLARAFQGLGSSCTAVAGMSLLASCFTDDNERGKAFGIAMGGLASGALLGPVYGGYLYEYIGRLAPFLTLAGIILLNGGLQLLLLEHKTPKPLNKMPHEKPVSILSLLSDSRILLTALTICFGNFGIGMLEPNLPLWMSQTMGAGNFEQGMAFLPSSTAYLLSTNLFGWFGNTLGRRRCAVLGLLFLASAFAMIPFSHNFLHLVLPMAVIGLAVGMVDGTMMPAMGLLVDEHHSSSYGAAYAIGDSAFCVGFAFGPFLSGPIINLFGFQWMMFGLALLTLTVSSFTSLSRSFDNKSG